MSEIANRVESLPRLIEQAAAALAKATTAAEVLDAKDRADVAYTAAKATARFAKAKNAHDTVIAACRKAMGDAMIIEAQAQCRLADEYDAAQERGEVQKPGGDHTSSNVLKQNNAPTVEDVGLTRKQVHEARAVRDAEKAKPGIVRKTVDDKLRANKEPTRADVKRAISEQRPTSSAPPPSGANEQRRAEPEQLRREDKADPVIDRSALSMTAQQKLDAAQRKLERDFDKRVREYDFTFNFRVAEAAKKRAEEYFAPEMLKEVKDARAYKEAPKWIMTSEQFNKLMLCVHPDNPASIETKNEMTDFLVKLTDAKPWLIKPDPKPGGPPPLPTWEEMLATQRAKDAQKAAERAARRSNKNSPK